MTPERWRQIQELHQSARERGLAVLAKADPEVRAEVEKLLAQDFKNPASPPDLIQDLTATMVAAGSQLGPYRIEGKLGEGGMGEVFRAVDTRLGRAVAVKVLHEKFSDRFEREARAIAALNHPHICTLYDVGPNYLIMEFIEGETLAQRLKRGKLSMEETLRYGRQIAGALAAAHAKGITHRDLKPGNIMLAKAGVKVLDFGLAKTTEDETLTASRAVMGTPAYMAPEQREGKPADARTDIYSLGSVLYEMATGARAGSGERIPSRSLEKIVNRCLAAQPESRWQSVAELERALSGLARPALHWKAIAGAALAVLVLAAGGYIYLHRTPKLTDKDTIVVADFENKTADPVFDDTLRQGLSVELQQSPFLELISDQQVQSTLALMGRPKDARLSAQIAQQICERTGSAAILEGSIASLGSQYVLGLRAKSCATGSILDQEQIQAARREDVLNSLSQIARKFRTTVGESLANVEKHSTPLEQATTSSLEALKAYSKAMKVDVSSGTSASIPFFQRAVEIDPEFAMPYANLGLDYTGVGEWALARENTTKAWHLREHASDRERFFIDFNYDRQVTGNLEKAFHTLELWAQTYPRNAEPDPRDLMAGLSGKGTGRWETVIEQAKKSIATVPDLVFGYENLAVSYFFLDRFDQANEVLRQASTRNLQTADVLPLEYNIAFLKGEKEQMDRIAALAKGKRVTEHLLANSEALTQARSGRLQRARQVSIRAVNLAQEEGAREAAATYQAVQAVWEALYGKTPEAKSNATAALSDSNGRDVEYAAGLALGFANDSSRSEALAADLEKRFPEDTFVKFTYVPVLRALAALQRGRPTESVEQLQTALPYELAVNGLDINLNLGGLHSAYVRGEAFMAARQYAEAAGEFQKILDHRGLVGADPIGALAQLQLGRTFAQSGDKLRAKTAYQDFLRLWKDADPDIPILKQAKAEYAKLM